MADEFGESGPRGDGPGEAFAAAGGLSPGAVEAAFGDGPITDAPAKPRLDFAEGLAFGDCKS